MIYSIFVLLKFHPWGIISWYKAKHDLEWAQKFKFFYTYQILTWLGGPTLTNDKTEMTEIKIVKQLTVCSGSPDHTVWANIFLHSIVNKMEMELCIYVQL